MVRIFIDGEVYEAQEGDNVLAVAIAQGLDLPYFCWHPALGSVGACRQCAVKEYKDENDNRGRLAMACMTPVRDGLRISIKDAESVDFRASVIEWLMANHPHDCPVCDEGGECHLQDMTVMTGHLHRRYRFPKRTFKNQDLGPFIYHEMNRCITCYRCVRFYQDYAGGNDLAAFASKNHVYFGRASDGPLESPFSGNLVEVCPTGVFTDKTLHQHYTRKWDLQSAPTVCTHCGVGCNTLAGERYGILRRIANRYHSEINGYFICDRGRFGYEFVNSEQRLRNPLTQNGEKIAEGADAVKQAMDLLRGKRLIGIGSPRGSVESNYALWRLVGKDNFYSGLNTGELKVVEATIEGVARFGSATLAEVERCDAVIIIGDDVEATAPRLSLALRQSVRQISFDIAHQLDTPPWQDLSVRDAAPHARSPLFVLSPIPTALDAIATRFVRMLPRDFLSTATAISEGIRLRAAGQEYAQKDLIGEIAHALIEARNPLVIAGTIQGGEASVKAASRIIEALRARGSEAKIVFTTAEADSMGVGLLHGRPLEKLVVNANTAVIIVENDLTRRVDKQKLAVLLDNAGAVIVLDSLRSPTTASAHLTLPVTTFAEGNGTYINNEGRAQRAIQVYPVKAPLKESWRWLGAIGALLEITPQWQCLDEVLRSAAEDFPVLAPAIDVVPGAELKQVGMRIPRQPHRYSGRTAMFANRVLHEPAPPNDVDTPLTFSMEGSSSAPPPSLLPRYWIPRWNSYQAMVLYAQTYAKGVAPGAKLAIKSVGQREEEPPQKEPSQWIAVAIHHLFGSEELSAHAPGIAGRTPRPYAALHPDDATALTLNEGSLIEVAVGNVRWNLPVRFMALARGAIGLPMGIGPLRGVALPESATVRRLE